MKTYTNKYYIDCYYKPELTVYDIIIQIITLLKKKVTDLTDKIQLVEETK